MSIKDPSGDITKDLVQSFIQNMHDLNSSLQDAQQAHDLIGSFLSSLDERIS